MQHTLLNNILRRRKYSEMRRQGWKQLLERELGLYFMEADMYVRNENTSTTQAAMLT
jgi:hypothetical protein